MTYNYKTKTKECAVCSTEFESIRSTHKYCSNTCSNEAHKQRMGGGEHYKRYGKNNHLKRTYGITLDEYEAMYEAQEGRCATCGVHEDDSFRTLVVDHCHDTDEVRGLLCSPCNTALGLLDEDIDTFNNLSVHSLQTADVIGISRLEAVA